MSSGRFNKQDVSGLIGGEADPYEPCLGCGLEPKECICDPVATLEELEIDDANDEFSEGGWLESNWDWDDDDSLVTSS